MNPMRIKMIALMFLALNAAIADVHAAPDTRLGQKPYMGWSSWSLEATKYPGYGGMDWLTAEHVKQQSDAMHKMLQAHGYTYLNMDSGWQKGYDDYGRPAADPKKFPLGIADTARHIHQNGQKFGIYWIPGVSGELYKANPLILGSTQHIQEIVVQPLRPAEPWKIGYQIDYTQPGAQAYVNSVARQFADWGADFLKLDGITPGSFVFDLSIDSRPDVAAWSKALKQTGRPIWLELSAQLDRFSVPTWQREAHGRRVTQDVETYGNTLVGWSSIPRTFEAARDWASYAGPGKGWNDLDSLDIGSGEMDGLTRDERQTVMTLWAIACSPLSCGDDLTKLDADGLQMLTNDEVIAVDQSGIPASPIVSTEGQVWVSAGKNGSKTVALFNRADHPVRITARWRDLGLTRPAQVRDLWSRQNLGRKDSLSAVLPAHGSRLFKITP